MATANFILPTDMSQGYAWYGYVENATSTEILIWQGYGGDAIRYKGNGFQYDYYGNVVGGTLTAIDYAVNVWDTNSYSMQFQITGLNLYAPALAYYVNSGNYISLLEYVLSGNDTFNGSSGSDVLAAFDGNDSIFGNNGNDILWGMNGNDTIDGGAGADVADYQSSLSDYAIIKSGSNYYVSGPDGNDTLLNVEKLTFNDFSVNLTIQGAATSGVTADEVNKIAELYVAYFNRVPEADGLEYWINTYKNGVSMADISRTFYDVGIQYSELTGYTSSMSLESFIGVVYQNVLGRNEVDAGGLEFWVTSITEGRQTRQDLVASILSAAHTYKLDPDWHHVPDLLDNKIVVANYFAIQNGLNYLSPEDSITQGMAMAAGITSTDTTAAIDLIGVHDIEIMVV